MSETSVLPRSSRGFVVASNVLGTIGLVVALAEPTLAFISGLLGLYFGLLAREGSSPRMATVGVAINAAALIVVTAILVNVFPYHLLPWD